MMPAGNYGNVSAAQRELKAKVAADPTYRDGIRLGVELANDAVRRAGQTDHELELVQFYRSRVEPSDNAVIDGFFIGLTSYIAGGRTVL